MTLNAILLSPPLLRRKFREMASNLFKGFCLDKVTSLFLALAIGWQVGCGRPSWVADEPHVSKAWFVRRNALLAPHIGNVISPIPENCIRTIKKGGDHKTAAHIYSAAWGCLQAALINFLGLTLMLICLGLSASGISRCMKMVRMPSTNCASSTLIYSARRNIFEKARLAIP